MVRAVCHPIVNTLKHLSKIKSLRERACRALRTP